jgi:hypothetical protein
MRELARKGNVTVVEHEGGKTTVAIQAGHSVLTLENGPKDKLIAELCSIVRNWPDMPREEERHASRGVSPRF